MISPHVPAGQTVFVYLLQHIDKAFVLQGQQKTEGATIIILKYQRRTVLRGGEFNGKRSQAAPFTVSLLGVSLCYALRDGWKWLPASLH